MIEGHTATSEIVGGALTRQRFIAEIFKVFASLRRRAKVDLPAFIHDNNFIEELVDTLATLVPVTGAQAHPRAGREK